jgi:NAD-reducing hydrogenase small subunit
MSNRIRLATVWLDGCSGCHMSLLDLDEGLLAAAQKFHLVYSPIADLAEFPDGVDVTLVEGAVSSQEDLSKIQAIRSRTRVLAALGDCAVTANVPSMRNTVPVQKLLQAVYVTGADAHPAAPSQGVPALLPQARPLHDFVKVDAHLPGCPPRPEAILGLLTDLIQGRAPKPAAVKFG